MKTGARIIRLTFNQDTPTLQTRVQVLDCDCVPDAADPRTCYTHKFDVHIHDGNAFAREIAECIARHTIAPKSNQDTK